MTKRDIKRAMLRLFLSQRSEYIDACNEINCTKLAEDTAHALDHDEWLDDDTHDVWDCAVEISEEA